MHVKAWVIGAAACATMVTGACQSAKDSLRISWDKTREGDMLTIESARIPGGPVQVWYLEAFCRRGSTDRDWNETTVLFKTEKLPADPAGRWVKLRTVVDGKVEIKHELRAGADEVDIRMDLVNRSVEAVDIEWAQPCMRVGGFTGRGQDDYFEKCFIFTEKGLTRMHQTHRETNARYTPGQVYVPAGIDPNDVNPRPVSQTRPVNGLVGCFSADETMIVAMAFDHTQELFQGIIKCIHSDFRIGGMKPGERKRIRGKIYVVPNDVPTLLKRYERDFPSAGR
jgi:hypothetical protein